MCVFVSLSLFIIRCAIFNMHIFVLFFFIFTKKLNIEELFFTAGPNNIIVITINFTPNYEKVYTKSGHSDAILLLQSLLFLLLHCHSIKIINNYFAQCA